MKRICKIFVVLLVMAIALFSFPITAGATEVSNTQDGLVASITSEKDSYKSNEDIELTFKVTNTNDFAVENLSLEAIIPDGLTLKNNDDTTVNIVSLASGESLELTLTAVKESSVIVVPIGTTAPSTEKPTQTQPVATETTENTKETATTAVVQTESVQATTVKANSATSDNTAIKTGNNMSYILVGLICLVCLAVAVISFRFRKKAVKYLSLVLCVCIAVSSVVVLGIPNASAEETTQQMSFEVSKTITVDSLNYELKSVISYSVTIDLSIYEEYQVSEAIDDLSSSDDFDNLSDDEKASKYIELLQEFSDKGLVKKGSIDYDNGIVGFEYKNGTQYLIEVISHSNKHEQELELLNKFYSNSVDSNIYTINNSRNALKTISVAKSQSINAVIMYDWFNYGENEEFDKYFKEIVDNWENNGIKTSLFINPIVQDYKTAFLNKDIIEIGAHGLRYKNSTYICVSEKTNETKDKAYKDDLENHRIIKERTDDGEYHYYISSKFFEYYYKDGTKLDDSIVFLESCYGFGENAKNDYNYADSFIKAGAGTIIGYNHTTTVTYVMEITEFAVAELIKGNTICDSIDIAKTKCGSDSNVYCEKTGLGLPEIPISPIIRGNTEKKLINEPIAGEISGVVYEENRKEAINDVRIKVYDSNNKIVNGAITGRYGLDDEGHFIINALSEGYYKFVFSKDGYKEKTLDVQVKNGVDHELVITMEKDNGSLSASVVSADNNTPLSDVRIEAYLKLESGTQYVDTTYTDNNGNFSMELQEGNYEIKLEKDGYKTAKITPTISNNQMFVIKEPIVMEKEITENAFKVSNNILYVNNKYILSDGNSIIIKNTINDGGIKISNITNTGQLLSNGTIIYFTVDTGNRINGHSQYDIYSVNIDGSNLHKITSGNYEAELVACENNSIYYIDSIESQGVTALTDLIKYDINKKSKKCISGDNLASFAQYFNGKIYYCRPLFSIHEIEYAQVFAYDIYSESTEIIAYNSNVYNNSSNDYVFFTSYEYDYSSGDTKGMTVISLNKNDEIKKSKPMPDNSVIYEISSDGSFAIITNPKDFIYYKFDLLSGEMQKINGLSQKYYNVIMDDNIYFIEEDNSSEKCELSVNKLNENTVSPCKIGNVDSITTEIKYPTYSISNGYLITGDLNIYKIN